MADGSVLLDADPPHQVIPAKAGTSVYDLAASKKTEVPAFGSFSRRPATSSSRAAEARPAPTASAADQADPVGAPATGALHDGAAPDIRTELAAALPEPAGRYPAES
jgi:hypothetical protein